MQAWILQPRLMSAVSRSQVRGRANLRGSQQTSPPPPGHVQKSRHQPLRVSRYPSSQGSYMARMKAEQSLLVGLKLLYPPLAFELRELMRHLDTTLVHLGRLLTSLKSHSYPLSHPATCQMCRAGRRDTPKHSHTRRSNLEGQVTFPRLPLRAERRR